jgi:hypothetical protein
MGVVMAELKTKKNTASVTGFLKKVADPKQRADAFRILELMKEVTGLEPKMWGPGIVGFGEYHYRYASGHEGDTCMAGFSPRKGNLTLYILPDFEPYADLMKKLGKYKTGKCCLYIKKLEDIDLEVLRELIDAGFTHMRATDHVQPKKEPSKKARKEPRMK